MIFPADETVSWLEEHLQEAAATYLNDLELRGVLGFAHIPNGGKRPKHTAAKLKKHGVKAGHPDLEIYLPAAKTVFIELKTWTGPVRDSQTKRHDLLRALGFDVHIILGKSPAHTVNQIKAILLHQYSIKEAQ